jgi:hypothetical protein
MKSGGIYAAPTADRDVKRDCRGGIYRPSQKLCRLRSRRHGAG